jgi:hypothetical protein
VVVNHSSGKAVLSLFLGKQAQNRKQKSLPQGEGFFFARFPGSRFSGKSF